MREGIARRRLLVEIDDAVVDHLAQIGFHPRYGARPLLRAIEQAVIQPLARVIVSERPEPGALIRFSVARRRDRATLHALEIRRIAAGPPRAPGAAARRGLRPRGGRRRPPGRAGRGRGAPSPRRSSSPRAVAPASSWRTRRASGTTRRTRGGSSRALYQLQQLAERRTAIARPRRAGSPGWRSRCRQSRDRHRLPELRDARRRDRGRPRARCRLETSPAAHSEREATRDVRVTPIGPDAEPWAEALLAMYAAWAERTGRERRPARRRPARAADRRRREPRAAPPRDAACTGAGSPTADAARPRGGRARPASRPSRRATRRPPPSSAATARAGTSSSRTREPGRRRRDVAGVLERGLIDDFLVAELRQTAAQAPAAT